ncbi:MAG: hypothetical protein Q9190_007148 [Brigantiaea leucoxantha]
MAHVSQRNRLAERLMMAVIHASPDDGPIWNSTKTSVINALADPRPVSTNQFEVESKLNGLEEKFRVFNNDELADALRTRLDELSGRLNKWTPEVLSLLLELSDRPLQNTELEDLDVLKPPPSSAPLTWHDIVTADPLDNQDGIWKDVDFGADTSEDDDDIVVIPTSASEPWFDSKFHPNDMLEIPDLVTVSPDETLLQNILEAQFWNRTPLDSDDQQQESDESERTINLTETQVIPEIASLLLGLPTAIFSKGRNDVPKHSGRYQLTHVSQEALIGITKEFIDISEQLALVRNWIKRDETVPVSQTFQAALAMRLSEIDCAISMARSRFLGPTEPRQSSLLHLLDEVQALFAPFKPLCQIVADLNSLERSQIAFKTLDFLYCQTCELHNIGEMAGFEYIALVFFECFHTYFMLVKNWMEEGEIVGHDRIFFIEENENKVPLKSIWESQHRLVYSPSKSLHAPSFLHMAAKKILVTGKSIHFLKKLGFTLMGQNTKPELEFPGHQKVCGSIGPLTICSFSERFNVALDRCIAQMHHSWSAVLLRELKIRCGLDEFLESLQFIFLYRDGALSDSFASIVFQRMNTGKESWSDGFVLTELLQNTFTPLSCIDTARLSVRSAGKSHHENQSIHRSVKALESLRVHYILPWPVANIVKEESMVAYQRIFVFLMQVQRTKQILERRFPRPTLPSLTYERREASLLYSLRHRFLWFANTLWTYLTDIVLSSASKNMRLKMERAEDFDEIIVVHQDFIAHVQEQCLISVRLAPIHKAVISLLDLAIMFSDAHANRTSSASLHLHNRSVIPKSSHKRFHSLGEEEAHSDPSDETDSEPEKDADRVPITEAEYVDTLKKLYNDFKQLHSFVTAGLQGVSRAGGEPCWELLADGLATEGNEDLPLTHLAAHSNLPF